jgi:hypothetical protein
VEEVLSLEMDRLLVSIEAGRGAVVDVDHQVRRDVITTYTHHLSSGAQVEEVNQLQPAVSGFNTQEKNVQPSRDVALRRKVRLDACIVGFGLVTALGISGTVAGHGRKCI